MAEHPNVSVARELMEAFNAGDEDRIKARMADDVKWHMIGGDTTEGLEALAAYMADAGDDFSITTDVHDIVGNDEHVVALVNATANVGGQTLNYRTAEIMHVEDGKVTERWAFSDDTAAINEFFGQFS
ncbi:MAG TPA: nuclear transport factor 2 family protein [Acidimicrobiia bacterium]|nr:nuclear transport factor 2 family protein [Acidimicrobiia bacterium]